MSYTHANQSNQDQNAYTNLDQDLKKSRQLKYENSESEVKEYIFKILSIPTSLINEYDNNDRDLLDILKDGEILCKLGKLLQFPNNPCVKYKSSRMPFVQMENISFFLTLCQVIGVPHDEIFQTVDLFERKDPYQIVITLISFSRIAHKLDHVKFPIVIGPKSVKIKPHIPRKPINLRSQ